MFALSLDGKRASHENISLTNLWKSPRNQKSASFFLQKHRSPHRNQRDLLTSGVIAIVGRALVWYGWYYRPESLTTFGEAVAVVFFLYIF